MRLTTRSRYGTTIVLDIALHGAGGPVRIRDISKRHGVSEKYLAKLIQELRKARIIESKRGPRGGHMLVRSPQRLTVGEIVTVLEGEEALFEMGRHPEDGESFADCVQQRIWQEAGQAVLDRLNDMTIAQLVADARACRRKECCLKGRTDCPES